MQVVVASPGSNKTLYILGQFKAAIGRGDRGTRLLVPTATMAEHFRNHLAREGAIFSPSQVTTFAKFVNPFVADLADVPTGALEALVAEALLGDQIEPFQSVAHSRGFRRTLATTIEEYLAAGGTPQHLRQLRSKSSTASAFRNLLQAVESKASDRKWVFRPQKLRAAAQRIERDGLGSIHTILITGFYSFTLADLDLLRSCNRKAAVTITLPRWAGAAKTLQMLKEIGGTVVELPARPVAPLDRRVFTVRSMDAEAAEIARRILEENGFGRPFREMAIVVRSEQPYVPAIKQALSRFQIPFHSYFGSPLIQQASCRFLLGLVDSMLGGWDHQELLPILRLECSPLETAGIGDAFEFRCAEHLPSHGLAGLRRLAPQFNWLWAKAGSIEPWAASRCAATEWARRFSSLTSLLGSREVPDRVSHESALRWRSRAHAITAFSQALEQAALHYSPTAWITCCEFRKALNLVLDQSSLRVPDHRRDTVHVMDAYEARQWKLPVVYLCGLIEKQFPKYHSVNPVLGDEVREELQSLGLNLRTSRELQQEEQFLFHSATTRATAQLTLSAPLLNAKGESEPSSFFLERYCREYEVTKSTAEPARPAPKVAKDSTVQSDIRTEELQAHLVALHGTISATAIESFLQCPFQFFSKYTLRFTEPPPDPAKRLDVLLQGQIAHKVLERVLGRGEVFEIAFEEEFVSHCDKRRVPNSYRTEAIRLELLHHLSRFVRSGQLNRSAPSHLEHPFDAAFDGRTRIRGRIDRIDVGPSGRATIIDYKYKSAVDKDVKAHKEGRRVQAGIYLWALTQQGALQAEAMLYTALKTKSGLGGWVAGGPYRDLGHDCSPAGLNESMRQAREITAEALAGIREGIISAKPADEERCRWCAYASICRVETGVDAREGEAAVISASHTA